MRRDVARRSMLVFGEQIAAAAIALLGTALGLRRLGAANFGVFSVAMGLVQLSVILTTEFDAALPRLLPELRAHGDRAGARALLWRILAVRSSIAITIGLTWLFAADVVSTLFPRTPGLAAPLRSLAILPLGTVFVETAISRAFGLERFVLRASITVGLAAATLVAALATPAGGNPARYAIGYAGWTLLVGTVATIAGAVRTGIAVNPGLPSGPIEHAALARRAWRYSWPLSLSQAMYVAYQNFGRVIFGLSFPPAVTGLLGFAFSTIERITGLAAAIPAALLPALAGLRVRGRQRALGWAARLSTRIAGGAAVLIFAGLSGASVGVTLVLGGRDFLPAAVFLSILAVQAVFRLPSQPVGGVLQAYEDTRSVLAINAAKFGGELILYLILIPPFGAIGACLAVVLSYLLALVLSMGRVRRYLDPLDSTGLTLDVVRAVGAAAIVGVAAAAFASHGIPSIAFETVRGVVFVGGALIAMRLTQLLRPRDMTRVRAMVSSR